METKSSPISQLKPVDQEAQEKGGRNKGGWITLPFIAGSMLGLGLAIHGTSSNLLLYLLKEYNVDSIQAVKISSNVLASLYLVPVAGAIVSDSYFGCFPIIIVGTAINVLAFILFILSAALPSLRPPRCDVSSAASCQHGTTGQLAVLYAAVCLLAIGTGGTRFNIATMGAEQFGSVQDQESFFNWYFVFLITSFIIGNTAIVYLQDSLSWVLGFSVCLAATVVSLVIFLLGARYYQMPTPKGSPYTELARVLVAAVRKARVNIGGLEGGVVQYYAGDGTVVAGADGDGAPSKRLRFLNRAAMITSTDSSTDESGGHRSLGWRLCTVRQVEDLKSLLGTLPIWSSGVLLNTSVGVMIAMAVLQALSMDRSLGPRFKVPAGCITVASLASFITVTIAVDRAVFPLWRRATGAIPKPLQRVGLGHVINVTAMLSAALVERRRLSIVREHHAAGEALGWVTPMSVAWLIFPLGLAGAAEAVHFPGNMAFYYQEFPKALRSMATAMAPLLTALGFFLTTPFVEMVKRHTSWLPLNINQGKLDNVYWTLAAVAAVNFGYFLICVSLYKNRE